MPRHNEQQPLGLQRPDATLQDATGRGGVEQHTPLSISTKEMLIGAGVLGLGLATATEAQAQQNESEDDLDTAPVIGTLTVGPGVLFRTEATTRSSSVQRDRSLNTYEVIDVVEGQSVSLNGTTSTVWYHIRIPGQTVRYAFVSAAVRPQYTELQLPTATATPTLTPTATRTETTTPTPTPEQEITTTETGEEIVGIATVRETGAVIVSNPQIRVTARTNTILGEAAMDEELQVVEVIMDGVNYRGSNIWYGVILPDDFLQADRTAATATPTPTPSPTPDASYEMRNVSGRGQVPIGYVSLSQVRFRLPSNSVPTREAPTITEEIIPSDTATPVQIAQVPEEVSEEISVAALPSSSIDLPNDRLVPVDVVRQRAPRTYQWSMIREVNIQGNDGVIRREIRTFDTRTIRIVPENIGTLIDIYGNLIQHGIYSPNNPPPVRPELLPQPQNINGQMAEYGYIVGIFSFGVSPSDSDGAGAITFFAEGTNTPVHVEFKMNEMFNNVSIGVQASNGSEVGTPADDRGRISVGDNPTTNLLINYENRTLTIPTENGPLVIHEGDEIMLAILWNQEISNYARHWGDQMPSEWSETVFDNNPNNDPQQIFVEQMGLIVSDRSAISNE